MTLKQYKYTLFVPLFFRDCSQTLVRAADAKKFQLKKFQGPPLEPQFFSGPFSPRKIGVNVCQEHMYMALVAQHAL